MGLFLQLFIFLKNSISFKVLFSRPMGPILKPFLHQIVLSFIFRRQMDQNYKFQIFENRQFLSFRYLTCSIHFSIDYLLNFLNFHLYILHNFSFLDFYVSSNHLIVSFGYHCANNLCDSRVFGYFHFLLAHFNSH